MQHRSRRFAAGIATALVLAGLALASPAARATSTFSFTRFAGTDRYGTAVELSTASGFSNRDTVLLATGENFPDALAGNFLAGALSTPVLLTTRTSVPLRTSNELVRLGAKNVRLLGGASAISDDVRRDLEGRGYTVTRVEGATRYDTAYEVAKAGAAATTVGTMAGKRTALLATGQSFADALAAGPAAYAGKLPVLLTTSASLSPQARRSIQELGIQQVVILGGTAAVGSAVETELTQLQVTFGRLAGIDRTETATLIAQFELDNLNFSNTHINLARGDDYADALAGGAHGGRETAAVLLAASPTSLDTTSGANARFLSARRQTLETGHIFGGTSAISATVEEAARNAAGAAPPEALAGASAPTVNSVVLAEDYFTGGSTGTVVRSYFYDSNDRFQFSGTAITTPTAGLAGFESLLNPGDVVTVTYDPNASGQSTFNITKDVVHAPIAPGATATAAGSDEIANDINVGFIVPSNNSSGTTYDLIRYQVFPNCSGQRNPQSAETVKTGITASGTFLDEDPAGGAPFPGAPSQLYPSGCFEYVLRAKSPAPSTVTADSPASNRVQVPQNDTTRPTIAQLTLTDAATTGTVSQNDVHTFRFSEQMDDTTAADGATYRLVDGDGTQVDIVCGAQGNATCELEDDVDFDPTKLPNAQPRPISVLTVTLTKAPTAVSPGSTSTMTYPVTLISVSAGFKDGAGNALTLTGSDTTLP